MKFVPGKLFLLDNFQSLQVDSVCSGRAFPEVFGITPTTMEQVVPGYLQQKQNHSHKIVCRKDAEDAKKITWFFSKKMTLRSSYLSGEMSLC